MDDPLGVSAALCEVDAIPSWGCHGDEPELNKIDNSSDVDAANVTFPFVDTINKKVSIWDGDVITLRADALVNSTNEGLNEKTIFSNKIHSVAGPDLKTECDAMGTCRTGDIKVSKGYNLPYRFVFHTVGPRFNKRYRTAAESALYSCTRSTLTEMRERKVRTLALPPINTPSRNYVTADAAPIILRTIRRFLDKHGSCIDRIVLCLTDVEREEYYKILPMYFPRSDAEAIWSQNNLPEDIGNADGEPVIEERKIRIMTGPMVSGGDDDDDDEADEDEEEEEEMSPALFAQMTGDHDKERRKKLMLKDPKTDENNSKLRYYQALLKKARNTDLSAIAKMRICAPGGTDREGNRVISFALANAEPSVNPQMVTLAVISAMDSIVNKPYIIVQYQSGISNSSVGTNILKDLFSVCDNRYRVNLRHVYVIHSSFWTRATSLFSIAGESLLKERKKTVQGLKQLFELVSPEQVDVPDYVWKYDERSFGAINNQTGVISGGEDL